LTKNIKLISSADSPLVIFGIVTNENILKLCWTINRLLNIRLSQSHGLTVNYTQTNEPVEFSLYQFEDENMHLKYSLFGNRSKMYYYFNELKNIDQLFFIRGNIDIKSRDSILQTLKSSIEITSVLSISPEIIKLKKNIEHF
jgi:hypothetical protein